MPPRPRDPLFWGLLLIALGGLFLLNNLRLLSGPVFAWWPVLVLLPGLWLLSRGLSGRQGGGMVGGTLLLGLGVFWLLVSLGLVGNNLFLPVLFLALGLGLLLRSVVGRGVA
ncbi:MAG: hypothetical protein IT317_06915 [Anaerolineales bacterium]|nr:hypothetical protein [Anaerolineales bacterium]